MCLECPGRIWIGKLWMPILIPIRIRQNDGESDSIRLWIHNTCYPDPHLLSLEEEIFEVSVSTHLDNFVYVGSELRYQLSHPAVILHEPSRLKIKLYNLSEWSTVVMVLSFLGRLLNGYVITIRLHCTRFQPGRPIAPSYLSDRWGRKRECGECRLIIGCLQMWAWRHGAQ